MLAEVLLGKAAHLLLDVHFSPCLKTFLFLRNHLPPFTNKCPATQLSVIFKHAVYPMH